jgi:hypothetical protein
MTSKSAMPLVMTASVSCGTEPKVVFDHILQLILQPNQIYSRRQDYWRRPICLPVTVSSCVEASAPAGSVSIDVVLRRAKKLRVATSLVG